MSHVDLTLCCTVRAEQLAVSAENLLTSNVSKQQAAQSSLDGTVVSHEL